jgi:hypothetical protein
MLVAMSLFSCTIEGSSDQAKVRTAKDYGITLLFEYDSVKVYRFYDPDAYQCVYFTNTNGKAYYEYTRRSGKYTHTRHRVETLNAEQ